MPSPMFALARQTARHLTSRKRPLLSCCAQSRQGLATETAQPTPVPPPPPSTRNRVYPAVLLTTLAAVVYVAMT